MAENCPNCGYEGEREPVDRENTYSILGIAILDRKYGALECPECEYEETI